MKRRVFITTLSFVVFWSMSCVWAVPTQANEKKYSGSGRFPPKTLSERHKEQIKRILPLIPSKYDPYEILAIGMVESSLTDQAISHTGDYGLMQVNCRIHRKRLKEVFGYKDCEKDMLVLEKNMKASLLIIDLFRSRYRQCRGPKLYSCYNGGQGWKFVQKKCLEKCEGEKECRKCTRPARYAKSVKRHIRFIKRKYKKLIETSLKAAEHTKGKDG